MPKQSPMTHIEFKCEGGCNAMINVRVDRGTTGTTTVKYKHCRNDHQQFEIHISVSGGIWVYQSDKFGGKRHMVPYRKIWQER